MKKKLEWLSAIDGVRGCMVFDGTKVLESTFAGSGFEAEPTGLVLSNAFVGIGHFGIGSSTDQITYTFENAVVFTKRIEENLFLNVLCDKNVDLSNLNVSANVLVDNPTKVMEGSVAEMPSEASAALVTTPLTGVEEVMGGALGLVMENLKDLITCYVGPVSSLVMENCVENWIADGPPELSRIPELVRLLADEIDIANHRVEFITKAKTLMDSWV